MESSTSVSDKDRREKSDPHLSTHWIEEAIACCKALKLFYIAEQAEIQLSRLKETAKGE